MHPINFLQFAEAYNNLQNMTRRHIHVHEPLIYDSVWVAATALHYTELLLGIHFEQTLNSTMINSLVEGVMQHVFENSYYAHTGLTVSCACLVHAIPHALHKPMHPHSSDCLISQGNIEFVKELNFFRRADRFLAFQYNLLPGMMAMHQQALQ